MNLKRIFGTILTILGIIALIYTGVAIVQHTGQTSTLLVTGIIGLLFFFTGISLIRGTTDTVK